MKVFLIACLLVGGDAAEWQKTLAQLSRLKDNAAALKRVAVLEKGLTEAGTLEAKARLGELIVRAKLPRLGMMAQGMEATRAIGLFESVIKEQPDNVAVLYLHARTCLALPAMFGKRDAAVASIERLVALADKKPGTVPSPVVFLLLAKLKPATAEQTLRIGLRSFPADKRLEAALGKKPPAPDPAMAKNAKKRFLAALLANKLEYALLDRALAAGQALHPGDHEYPLYRGLLRLWQLEVVPGERVASEGIEHFRKALALNPKDTRIYGWLGPLLYVSGHVSGMKDIVAEGEQVMAVGVAKNPEQNLFGRALAYRMTATNKEQLVDDLYRTMELCSGKKMDRARFVLSPTTRDHPSCKDTKYAPFNVAGTLFWAGEYFLAEGDMVRARDAFEGALRTDDKKAWPYRKLAEERIAATGAKRMKLTKGPASCMLCHRR